MDNTVKVQWYWQYPMKPVRITEDVFRNLKLSGYSLERKYDGFRVLATFGKKPQLWTRQKRVLKTPPSLLDELRSMKLPAGTVLDGEIWSLKKRGGWETTDDTACCVTFWDCMHNGTSILAGAPLEERQAALRSLLGDGCDRVRVVDSVEATLENLRTVQDEAVRIRSERDARSGFIHGIVLKRRGSPRRDHPTRSVKHPDWLKVVFPGMEGWEPRQ
jgi:ATP-dependent DNA ligase